MELVDCQIFLIGCKQDLTQAVPQEEIDALTEKEGLICFKCSSTTNSKTSEAFNFIIHSATERLLNNSQKPTEVIKTQGKHEEASNSFCNLI